MKISVIISTLLIAQVSGSFFDVFQGAVLSVQNSFGKLLSDVVTDVKDTVDCTILAVEHVLSLSADATTRYYDKCGTGNKTSTTAGTQQNGPQAVEITIETSNEEYLKREIPQEIDAKINETLSRLFHGYNAHDELESVEKELARETERLGDISGLIKLELEKISSDIHVDFKNIEQKASKPSVDTILEELKLLEAIERNINDPSEANKIHQIIDNILLKLKNIEDSESKENNKVDGILKDIENNTNKTYKDIWDQLNDWKREEARHLNLIQNKMEEHDKSPEHVVYVQYKDSNNQQGYQPYSTNKMSPEAPMTSIDTLIATPILDSTLKSTPGSSYLPLAQPPLLLPLAPSSQNTGRLLPRALGADDSLNDVNNEPITISLLTTPLSSTATGKHSMLVTELYTTPKVLNQETMSTKVSHDNISNRESTNNSMISKTMEVTTLAFKQLTSTTKIVSQQPNIRPKQTSVTETAPVFITSSNVNEEKQLQASPSISTDSTLRTTSSITTQKPQIRIATQMPSKTLESIAYLPITTSAITTDVESTTSKSTPVTTIHTTSAISSPETTSASITTTPISAQSTTTTSASSPATGTFSNLAETSTTTLSAPETIKTTTTITTEITSAPRISITTPTTTTSGTLTIKSVPDTVTSTPQTTIGTSTLENTATSTTSDPETNANTTSNPGRTNSSTPSAPETTTTNITATSAPKTITTSTNAPKTSITTTTSVSKIIATATSSPKTTSSSALEATTTTTTTTRAPESTTTTATIAPRTTTTISPETTTTTTKAPETTTNAPKATTNTTRVTTTTPSTPEITTITTTCALETTTPTATSTTETTTTATSAPETTTIPTISVTETTNTSAIETKSISAPEITTNSIISVPETPNLITTGVPETTTIPTTSVAETTTSVTEITTIPTTSVPETTTSARETAPSSTKTTTSITETTTSVTETTTRVPETTTITTTSVPETTTITTTSVSETTTVTTESSAEKTTSTTPTTTSAPQMTMTTVPEEAITNNKRANMDMFISDDTATEKPRTTRPIVPTPSLNAFLNYIDRIMLVTTPRSTLASTTTFTTIRPKPSHLLPKFISSHNFHHPTQGKPSSAHMTRDGTRGLISSQMFHHSLASHFNSIHTTISPLLKFMQHHPSAPNTLSIPAAYSAPIPYARNSNLPPAARLIPQSMFNQNPPHIPPSKNVNRPPDFFSRRSLKPVEPTSPKTNNFDDPDYDSFFHMPPKNSEAHQQALREARQLIANSKQAHNVINSFLNKKKKGINPFNRTQQLKIGK